MSTSLKFLIFKLTNMSWDIHFILVYMENMELRLKEVYHDFDIYLIDLLARFAAQIETFADLYHKLLNPTPTIIFTFKLVLSICLLIVIRGGVPRYRYDFLTKMGWIKFLALVVSLFFITFSLAMFL